MSHIDELVQRYIASWNETDAGRRRAAIDQLYTERCGYTDPLAAVSGREGSTPSSPAFRSSSPARCSRWRARWMRTTIRHASPGTRGRRARPSRR